jgi:hypothetical protein
VEIDKTKANLYVMGKASTLVSQASRGTTAQAKRLVPVKTGATRASIGWGFTRVTRNTVTAKVGTPIKYAVPLHDGADPHIIRPRRKKALKFEWMERTVFFKKVHHPGIGSTPFLTVAMRIVCVPLGFRVERTLPQRLMN